MTMAAAEVMADAATVVVATSVDIGSSNVKQWQ